MGSETGSDVAPEPGGERMARVVGVLAFVLGVGLLVLAFWLAYQGFNDPEKIIPMAALTATPPPSPMSIYLPVALKLLLLLVMGYVGSQVAGRGAQVLLATRRGSGRAAGD